MQNIDVLVLFEPAIFIAFGAGLVVYWRRRRRFAGIVLLFSLAAYAGAIALKEIVQAFTAGWVVAEFGSVSWPTGIYFGAQTCIFEVGLAYLVARYAVSRGRMGAADAEAYGVALSFWENAILLGAYSLLQVSVIYVLIYAGLLPQSVYQNLGVSNPSLFYPPGQLIVPVAFGVLERVSSFLAHFSWGYLCVFAVCFRKRAYLLIALPMGLVDALVPFAQTVPLWEFEAIVFVLSLGFVLPAWNVTKRDRAGLSNPPQRGAV